jgi:hypothetical protein
LTGVSGPKGWKERLDEMRGIKRKYRQTDRKKE